MPECPNATATRGNGRCGGAGVLERQSQWVPRPSCWVAVGRAPLNASQTRELRRYHVLLLELTSGLLASPERLEGAAGDFDGACAALRRLGVSDEVRAAWVAWVESHVDAGALERLRERLSAPAEV